MSHALALGADVVAITLLTYVVYFRRHRRRDMLLAYIGLNVGVLAVTLTLTDADLATGVGLGLFGVLAIMRLRSSELSQEEVAYYFASLTLGLIAGLQPGAVWVAPALSALVVGAMYLADHPRVHPGYRHQIVTLDAVYPSEAQMVTRLEDLLGGVVKRAVVQATDLVRDQTIVDVRYRVHEAPPRVEHGPTQRLGVREPTAVASAVA